MYHRKTYMQSVFSKIGLVDQSKPCTQVIFAKKLQIEQICNLQLEFRKITLFGHALPLNGHLSQFRNQSAY